MFAVTAFFMPMKQPLPLSCFSNWLEDKSPANLLADMQQLDSRQLGLSHVARGSGLFVENSLSFSLLQSSESATVYAYRLGLFYEEVDTTCPCSGDEQTTLTGYCEMQLLLDPQNQTAVLTADDD